MNLSVDVLDCAPEASGELLELDEAALRPVRESQIDIVTVVDEVVESGGELRLRDGVWVVDVVMMALGNVAAYSKIAP